MHWTQIHSGHGRGCTQAVAIPVSLCSVTWAGAGCLLQSEPCSHSTVIEMLETSQLFRNSSFSPKNLRHASLKKAAFHPSHHGSGHMGQLGLQAWGKPT